MAARLAPLAPFLRAGTTRSNRIRVAWAQFVVLAAVLCALAGALALVAAQLIHAPAP